jgi:stage V sporulation protein K
MEQFFQSNLGLKSTFITFISFNDYSLYELVRILNYTSNQNDYIAEDQAIGKVRDLLQ